MAYVVSRFKVKDYEGWRTHFDALSELRKANGRISERVLRNKDHPDEIVLFFEWDDVERARKYSQSPELKKKLKESGIEMIDWAFLEEAEKLVHA